MKAFTHSEQVAPAFQSRGVELRRRLEKEWLQIASQFLQLLIDPDESFRIFLGYFRKLLLRSIAVGPPGDHLPIGKGNLDRRITGDHPQAIIGEPQLGNDFRPQHASDVRRSRGAAAGSDFFRDATSAHDVSALKYQGGEPGTREVGSRCESIVTGTDHNGVVYPCCLRVTHGQYGCKESNKNTAEKAQNEVDRRISFRYAVMT